MFCLEKSKYVDKRTLNNQGRSSKIKVTIVDLKQREGKVKAKFF